MDRNKVYEDIEAAVGTVPSFFRSLSDESLEENWRLFKTQLTQSGPIPPKYRELAGLAVASAVQCPYCVYAHREFARVFGATDAELEQAAYTAKHTAGWSTYIAGLGTDLDSFKGEIDQVCTHMRENK